MSAEKAAAPGGIEGALQLIDEWMDDDSSYEEDTWDELVAALDADRSSYRKLFAE